MLTFATISASLGFVLTADVRFEGWTTETWTRFLHLWKPRATPDRELTRPRGGVIAIHENGQMKKLMHTRTGRLDPRGTWPMPLAELAEAHHASWALSARMGALEDVMERFGARPRLTWYDTHVTVDNPAGETRVNGRAVEAVV